MTSISFSEYPMNLSGVSAGSGTFLRGPQLPEWDHEWSKLDTLLLLKRMNQLQTCNYQTIAKDYQDKQKSTFYARKFAELTYWKPEEDNIDQHIYQEYVKVKQMIIRLATSEFHSLYFKEKIPKKSNKYWTAEKVYLLLKGRELLSHLSTEQEKSDLLQKTVFQNKTSEQIHRSFIRKCKEFSVDSLSKEKRKELAKYLQEKLGINKGLKRSEPEKSKDLDTQGNQKKQKTSHHSEVISESAGSTSTAAESPQQQPIPMDVEFQPEHLQKSGNVEGIGLLPMSLDGIIATDLLS